MTPDRQQTPTDTDDPLARVHHHAHPGPRRGPVGLCGIWQQPRPLDECDRLPCCPLCHAVISANGWRCIVEGNR